MASSIAARKGEAREGIQAEKHAGLQQRHACCATTHDCSRIDILIHTEEPSFCTHGLRSYKARAVEAGRYRGKAEIDAVRRTDRKGQAKPPSKISQATNSMKGQRNEDAFIPVPTPHDQQMTTHSTDDE